MTLTAARQAINDAEATERRRPDEDRRLRRLLARSDVLLDQAECANLAKEGIDPAFARRLHGLVTDMAPSLLTPAPERLRGLHIRLALALRGWSRAQLAKRAGVRPDQLGRAIQSTDAGVVASERICETLARHPIGSPGARAPQPLNAQEMVDLVFDLQAVLFQQMAEAAGRAILDELEEELREEEVAVR